MNSSVPSTACCGIQEKIRQAHDIFDIWGDTLRGNPRVQSLLDGLRQKVTVSQDAMLDLGVVAACRHCDEEEGGSCCGAGIENKYSVTILLMNLLWGVALPRERYLENSCFFLDKNGCSLKIRDVLCVNYLCLRVQGMLAGERLIKLQNIVGDELDAAFVLHETIKKIVG